MFGTAEGPGALSSVLELLAPGSRKCLTWRPSDHCSNLASPHAGHPKVYDTRTGEVPFGTISNVNRENHNGEAEDLGNLIKTALEVTGPSWATGKMKHIAGSLNWASNGPGNGGGRRAQL
eukprot:9177216-Karenia_brevis.AAC.1